MLPTRVVVLIAVLAASLSSCSGDADVSDTDTGARESTSGAPSEDAPAGPGGAIVESGFGQSGQYAWVTALVHNDGDHGGQTVTVNFNMLDKSGQLVASGSQVASFSWADQDVPISTQVDLGPGVKADKMEATLLVEDEGTFDDVDPAGWESEIAGQVYQPQYSDEWAAKFTVTNPGTEPLKGSAVQVICHDADGKIMGGASTFPELIPASGKVLVDVSSVYATTKPADCLGYHIPWM